ncbi:MAG: hypothetical protein ACOCV2_12185 [Persicimonas sp.]
MEADSLTERAEPWLRVSAAILGTFLVALPTSVCMARFLPVAEDLRIALAIGLAIPAWVVMMCFAFAAKSGYHVWAVCLASAAVLGGAAFLL